MRMMGRRRDLAVEEDLAEVGWRQLWKGKKRGLGVEG